MIKEIISDSEIDRVHAYANFGAMPKRHVVNEGVVKAACGYYFGYTMMAIIKEHGLIKKDGNLTKKGKRYLRALIHNSKAWNQIVTEEGE